MAQLHVIGLNPTTGKLENLGGSNDSGGLVVQPSGASSPALEIQNNGSAYALKIVNNAAAPAIRIDQSGASAGLALAHSGNDIACNIVKTAGSGSALSISMQTYTGAAGLSASSAGTGPAASFIQYGNGTCVELARASSNGDLLVIQGSNLKSSYSGIKVDTPSSSTAYGISINNNANSVGLGVDNYGVYGIYVKNRETANGYGLVVENNSTSYYGLMCSTSTSVSGAYFYSTGSGAALEAYASDAVAGSFKSAGGSNSLNVEQSNTNSAYAPSAININIGSGCSANGISVIHNGLSSRDAFCCIRSSVSTYRVAPTGDIYISSSANIYCRSYDSSSYTRSEYVVVGPSSMRSAWTPTTGFHWEDTNCSSVLAEGNMHYAGESVAARTIPAVLWIPVEVPDRSRLRSIELVVYLNSGTNARFLLTKSRHSVTGAAKYCYRDDSNYSWVQDSTYTRYTMTTSGVQRYTLTFNYPPTLNRADECYWVLLYVYAGSTAPYMYVYNAKFQFYWDQVRPR
jgi:hypothetical protein